MPLISSNTLTSETAESPLGNGEVPRREVDPRKVQECSRGWAGSRELPFVIHHDEEPKLGPRKVTGRESGCFGESGGHLIGHAPPTVLLREAGLLDLGQRVVAPGGSLRPSAPGALAEHHPRAHAGSCELVEPDQNLLLYGAAKGADAQ